MTHGKIFARLQPNDLNRILDPLGNEWFVGPSRITGQPFEWDVQLSRSGREMIGWLSRDGMHMNVSRWGEVTHR
jgi:hypothetical protein